MLSFIKENKSQKDYIILYFTTIHFDAIPGSNGAEFAVQVRLGTDILIGFAPRLSLSLLSHLSFLQATISNKNTFYANDIKIFYILILIDNKSYKIIV